MTDTNKTFDTRVIEVANRLQRKGKLPKPNRANLRTILSEDPRCENAWRLNTFNNQIECSRVFWGETRAVGPMTDNDYFLVGCWLSRHYELDAGSVDIGQAVYSVAETRRFNPLVDYLNGVKWDGTPRIDTWLSRHLGVEENEYSKNVARKWLIAAVARVMDPGCQVDTVLILEGRQGLGKTSVMRALASHEYYCNTSLSLRDKDALLVLQDAWIVELAELESMRNIENVKAFLSQRVDLFRRPYARATERAPRHCVFAGTTNQTDYLRDDSGNRRFWPVLTTKQADIPALVAERDQLWAEAVAAYKSREPWYPDAALAALAEVEVSDRMETLPADEQIVSWVEKYNQPIVSREEILTYALRYRNAEWPKRSGDSLNHAIKRAMSSLKFSLRLLSHPLVRKGKRIRFYLIKDVRPSQEEVAQAFARRERAVTIAMSPDNQAFETAVEKEMNHGSTIAAEA